MTQQISMFLHCKKCLEECPRGLSAANYQAIEVGWTQRGLQIWCKRHDVNVMHVDFEGQQHPADLSDSGDFGGTKQ